MSLFPKYKPAKPANSAKPERTLATLAEGEDQNTHRVVAIQWQDDFCLTHGEFNGTSGKCPFTIDECLISRILDSGGDLDALRGVEIGKGITTDEVIFLWLESGEPAEKLLKDPEWFIYMAKHIRKNVNYTEINRNR
jgi:hypothetical protein